MNENLWKDEWLYQEQNRWGLAIFQFSQYVWFWLKTLNIKMPLIFLCVWNSIGLFINANFRRYTLPFKPIRTWWKSKLIPNIKLLKRGEKSLNISKNFPFILICNKFGHHPICLGYFVLNIIIFFYYFLIYLFILVACAREKVTCLLSVLSVCVGVWVWGVCVWWW